MLLYNYSYFKKNGNASQTSRSYIQLLRPKVWRSDRYITVRGSLILGTFSIAVDLELIHL